MQVELGRAVLRGRVDRLERDPDGALRVVDLKTGSSKPAAGDVGRHRQLGAYQVAVEHGAFAEHGTRSAGAALLQVGKAAGAKTTLQVQQPLERGRRAGLGRRAGRRHRRGHGGVAVPGHGRAAPASSVPCGPAVPCSPRAG